MVFISAVPRLRLRIRALTSRAESLRQLDRRILGFYRNDRRRFLSSVAFYLAGWIADSLDILLVSYLVGMPLDWSQALAFEAFIGVAKDRIPGRAIIVSAIDNLMKGASGQAVQSMNLMLGFPETMGLTQVALFP